MTLSITRQVDDLTLSGVVHDGTVTLLDRALTEMVDEGRHHLRLFVREVRYIDSSGLKVLIGALKRLSMVDGTITLVDCNPTLERVLHVTYLDHFLLPKSC